MTSENQTLTIGQAIDAIIKALEGINAKDRAVVIRTVSQFLEIKLDSTKSLDEGKPAPPTGPEIGHDQQPAGVSEESHDILDIRTLKEEKNPTSQIEMACVVAYYLSEMAPIESRKAVIDAKDITKYFKQAGYRLPKNESQVPIDAKAAGYFDQFTKGKYKLNPVGHNLVVHGLPRKKGGGANRGAKRKNVKKTRTSKPKKESS